ncbi:alpha/beta-hydrolase [Trichoderma barbatum]
MESHNQQYHVQKFVDSQLSSPFHRSVSALWEEKWKKLAFMGLYPFTDGKGEDFAKVFERLIVDSGDDPAILLKPDEYAKPFFPVGQDLNSEALKLEQAGDFNKACELYLRAAAVYRIARFPINRSPLGNKAWELGKEAFLRASPYLSPPNREVQIPFKYASSAAGESRTDSIGAFIRIPECERPSTGWPLVLFICGLDAYRTDQSAMQSGKLFSHISYGQAVLVVDIPGTADSPAARHDPESPDRLWSSVLDWVDEYKAQYGFDTARIGARGISTGGYYAMRIAHTHADRLVAVVAQGGGSHHMFDPAWILAQNHMEYPFALSDALAYKFGYEDSQSYSNSDPRGRFSLLETGIFDKKCTRLLVINGMEDSIFPIEDSILPLRHGCIKDARFINERGHMGFPEAEAIQRDWLVDALK